jgi:hypothetical protein
MGRPRGLPGFFAPGSGDIEGAEDQCRLVCSTLHDGGLELHLRVRPSAI